MGTELKTDSWHRYVLYRLLYRRDDFMHGTFADEATKKTAIDAGRKYTLRAHADVWARDAVLVARVRQFLGDNFFWHERLAKSGSDIAVVQMLQSMVRSGVSAVVVIPEEASRSGGTGATSEEPATSSFWGRTDYDAELDVPLADRYRAQFEQMNGGGPTSAQIRAMTDDMNAGFMHAMVLKDPVGMLPLFAQAGWISKYGLPDLSDYGADDDGSAERLIDGDAPTPLGDAQPFGRTR
jgi:hypothetical protein